MTKFRVLHPQKFWSRPVAAILNFGSTFRKSLAHPHVAKNVKLKYQKTLAELTF